MRLLILLLCLFPVHPAVTYADSSPDDLLSVMITGAWVQTSETYNVTEFSDDGTYEAKIYRTEKQKKIQGHFLGSWRIADEHLYITLTFAYPAFLPTGVEIGEEILQIGSHEMILLDEQGTQYSKFRIQ